VRVKLLDETDYRWEGWLDFTDNALDQGSGTIRLRAVLLNPRAFLRPGLIGHARLEGQQAYVALLVPDTAIVTDGSRKVAYVVGANNRVQAKPVALGPLSGDLRVIRAGVSASDRVIVNGVQRARPGMPVTVRQVRIRPSAPQPQAPPVMAAPASVATPVPHAASTARLSRPPASNRRPKGSAAAPRSDRSMHGR
jgi:multidrug efflux pump subunit AcrA (membrane-fusion protein)